MAILAMSGARLSAQQITWQVIGSGATFTSNGQITLMGTVGQSAIGTVEGGSTTAHLGFWVPRTNTTNAVPTTGGVASSLRNYPNPFTSTTTIYYTINHRSQVRVRVYDVSGQLVKELVDAVMDAGSGDVVWDGSDSRGEEASSGTYYFTMDAQPVDGNSANALSQRGKMLLVR